MPSKAEKRLARKEAAHREFELKKARQAQEPDVSKRVSQATTPVANKVIKETEKFAIGPFLMEWTRERVDVVGNWTWGPRSCLDDDWTTLLEPFLREYAKKTWNEIHAERTGGKQRRQKHVDYSKSSICSEAQERLVEIEMDDIDRIFRFRLSGRNRMYGIRYQQIFFVLWWDPEHNIFPTSVD
jgi:hypothetical protein